MKQGKKQLWSFVLAIALLAGLSPTTWVNAVDLEVQVSNLTELQEALLDPGNTIITLGDGTYEGADPLTLPSAVTLQAAANATPVLDIPALDFAQKATLKGLEIQGAVSGPSNITIEDCTLHGGLELTDDSTNQVTVTGTVFYYSNGTTGPAITVTLPTGTDPGQQVRGNRYTFGSSQAPNTFVKMNLGEQPVAVWPSTATTTVNYRNVWDSLDISTSYWKNGTLGNDAMIQDIELDGHVNFCKQAPLKSANSSTFYHKLEIPENLVLIKQASPSSPSSGFAIYSDSVQVNDFIGGLYNRTFKTSGQTNLLFTKGSFDHEDYLRNPDGTPISDSWWQGKPPLTRTYNFRYEIMKYYKDPSSIFITDWDSILNMSPLDMLYVSWENPMMPLTIQPKDMVSYAGGTSSVWNQSYPQPVYDFKAENIHYTPGDLSKGEEFIQFTQKLDDGTKMFNAYLSDDPDAYLPVSTQYDSTAKPELDKDMDGLPFVPSYTKAGTQTYKIDIENPTSIFKLGFNAQKAKDLGWVEPLLFYTPSQCYEFKAFYPEFQEGTLTVRPVSGDTSIETVILPSAVNGTVPQAGVADGAAYQNSAGVALEKAAVSLFNDNEEPNSTAYSVMETRVKSTGFSQYQLDYHHLALVDTSDANHLVTTTTDKTIYLPYPANYQANSPLSVVQFDYQRMPNDNAATAVMTVIQPENITKLENGFTFTVTSEELGSFFVAYNKTGGSTTPSDPDDDPPSTPEKPKPVDPEKPTEPPKPVDPTKPIDPTPETPAKPAPPEKPKLDDIIEEATKHPDTIIKDKDTLHEKYPELDIDNLPVPLHYGPDFAIIQLPDGELIAIDPMLVPLGKLPMTGTTVPDNHYWELLLLTCVAFFLIRKRQPN